MEVPLWLWAAFAATVVVSLAVDLLAHRAAHVIGFKEAAAWSALWVGALRWCSGRLSFLVLGATAGTEYTTAWLLEKCVNPSMRPVLRGRWYARRASSLYR